MTEAFHDLQQFLHYLERKGDLRRIHEEVNPVLQMASIVRRASDERGPAVLFENVTGSKMGVVAGVFATRERILSSLGLEGLSKDELVETFLQRLRTPVGTRLLSEGACKEVVCRHDEVDLATLPIPTFSERDGGPYVTMGLVISRDPETGAMNGAVRRLLVKGKNRLGIFFTPYSHLGIMYRRAEEAKKPLQIAVVVGCDPAIQVAAQWNASFGEYEVELGGRLRQEPVPTVKCETVDLEVPAFSEIVMEGVLLPGVREMEGPFADIAGYCSPAAPRQVFEVTGLSQRKNAVFQIALTGVPVTEHHVLVQICAEIELFAQLRRASPGVRDLHLPPCAGLIGSIAVVSFKQEFAGEARNVITTLLGHRRTKIVIAVDEDIDPSNLEMVLWAVATRSQPARDLLVARDLVGSGMDPSSDQRAITDKMGLDATRPFGKTFAEVAPLPPI